MGIEKLIGNTPLLEITKLNPNPAVKLYAKLEGNNPGGSVKDRAAYQMISHALSTGQLSREDTIIEPTSGNTGIALSMIAAAFGIKIKIVMPEGATPERVKTMQGYGAEVILTPKEKTIEYSRSYAKEQSDSKGYVLLDQFNNVQNRQAHILTTGPEIWRDTDGEVTHFVSSMGTTGTITGTSTYLKSQNPDIQIIGVQPKEGTRIPGIRKWSPEFLPGIYEPERIDDILYVSKEEAQQASRNLAKTEGIFAGESSGGAFTVAQRVVNNLTTGCVVFIACDRGDRYLSSDLY